MANVHCRGKTKLKWTAARMHAALPLHCGVGHRSCFTILPIRPPTILFSPWGKFWKLHRQNSRYMRNLDSNNLAQIVQPSERASERPRPSRRCLRARGGENCSQRAVRKRRWPSSAPPAPPRSSLSILFLGGHSLRRLVCQSCLSSS